MDIRASLVAQQYAANKPATAPDPTGEAGVAFGNAATAFIETLQQSEQTAMASMTGSNTALSMSRSHLNRTVRPFSVTRSRISARTPHSTAGASRTAAP